MKYIIPFFAGCLVFTLFAGVIVGVVKFAGETLIPELAEESLWKTLLMASWVILTGMGGCVSLAWKEHEERAKL